MIVWVGLWRWSMELVVRVDYPRWSLKLAFGGGSCAELDIRGGGWRWLSEMVFSNGGCWSLAIKDDCPSMLSKWGACDIVVDSGYFQSWTSEGGHQSMSLTMIVARIGRLWWSTGRVIGNIEGRERERGENEISR